MAMALVAHFEKAAEPPRIEKEIKSINQSVRAPWVSSSYSADPSPSLFSSFHVCMSLSCVCVVILLLKHASETCLWYFLCARAVILSLLHVPQHVPACATGWLEPLHLAAQNGHTEVVTKLLEHGADLCEKDEVWRFLLNKFQSCPLNHMFWH